MESCVNRKMEEKKVQISTSANNNTDRNSERPKYEKNEEYDQEAFNRVYDMWKLAVNMGNKKLAQIQINIIYKYCEKFVYKELWKRYPTLMKKAEHRMNLIQEVWLKLIEQLPNYDYTKAGITTFIALWIPHVGTSYYSDSFSGTTNYFTDAMQKVNAAENMLRVNNIDVSIDSLMKITKLPEVTITQAQILLRRKERVSYESMVIEQPSKIPTPEATVLQNEATYNLNNILEKELNDEELLVLQYLAAPDDLRKDVASYGEVVEKLNQYMRENGISQKYNVPKVKKIVSRISTKIVNNEEMSIYFPAIVKEYRKIGSDGDMPLLDDTEFLEEQKNSLMELFEQ